MKYFLENENNGIRITIEFLKVEEPKVTNVLRRILCDYKKSFGHVFYRRDPLMRENKNYYTELYIRKDDLRRATSLLKEAAGP